MTTRNLTGKFETCKEIRERTIINNENKNTMLIELYAEFEKTEIKINNEINLLKILQLKRFRVDFQTDDNEKEIEIQQQFDLTKNLINSYMDSLMKFKSLKSLNETEKTNIFKAKTNKLEKLLAKLNTFQRDYDISLNEFKVNTRCDELEAIFDEKTVIINHDIDRCGEEIEKISKNISELNSMFKRLHLLVKDQGTILDNILFNLETANDNTEKGVDYLTDAEKNQKISLTTKTGMFLSGLIVVFIGVLCIKHS